MQPTAPRPQDDEVVLSRRLSILRKELLSTIYRQAVAGDLWFRGSGGISHPAYPTDCGTLATALVTAIQGTSKRFARQSSSQATRYLASQTLWSNAWHAGVDDRNRQQLVDGWLEAIAQAYDRVMSSGE